MKLVKSQLGQIEMSGNTVTWLFVAIGAMLTPLLIALLLPLVTAAAASAGLTSVNSAVRLAESNGYTVFAAGEVPTGTPTFLVCSSTAQANSCDYEADGADDHVQINNAISACPATGCSVVLTEGQFNIAGIVGLPSLVELVGQGRDITRLAMVDGANLDAVIRTDNFATQTGTNSWFVDTEDVRYGFAIRHLGVNGNKANQTSGDGGIKLFGKGYTIEDVLIMDAEGVGFYSEAGAQTGQHDYRDLPEAQIEALWVRNSGQHGIQFRGPHDAVFGHVISAFNGGAAANTYDHVLIEFSSNTYNGASVWDTLHTYGGNNARYGLNITGTSAQVQIGRAYIEGGATGAVSIGSNGSSFDNLLIQSGSAAAGVSVAGSNNRINGLLVSGTISGAGPVVNVTGSRNRVAGTSSFVNNANIDDQFVISGGDHNYLDMNITNGNANTAITRLDGATTDNYVHVHGACNDGKVLDLSNYSGVRNYILIQCFKDGTNGVDWDDTGEPADASDVVIYRTQTKSVGP